ncbi:Hypothetical protein MexAM1_META2p1222 (plasmid) [Methylorubrum extorquens AM1]|uniref:Uncharacterized protein n=1 Tax=Methylorubrum extorquens (strain ATCC 14718 / DSM 1338 / JCM 2805 / NCIMB 9133 / AM1) TaxID=272630 RepID=C5B692_METEA|nr:Hypothetical protein MexAM1_META2p1222 [Methylorubrum extorquens AM1]
MARSEATEASSDARGLATRANLSEALSSSVGPAIGAHLSAVPVLHALDRQPVGQVARTGFIHGSAGMSAGYHPEVPKAVS